MATLNLCAGCGHLFNDHWEDDGKEGCNVLGCSCTKAKLKRANYAERYFERQGISLDKPMTSTPTPDSRAEGEQDGKWRWDGGGLVFIDPQGRGHNPWERPLEELNRITALQKELEEAQEELAESQEAVQLGIEVGAMWIREANKHERRAEAAEQALAQVRQELKDARGE